MNVVMTILVRDEADVIDAQIAYHLEAGVDFVIATDHESVDGTTEILERYAREGHLLRLEERGKIDEVLWRSRMARIAAREYEADWVINTDADEFWLSSTGTIRDVLAEVPEYYGVVGGVICHVVPRPDDGAPFFERMTARLVQHAPINDPTSPWRPSPKVVHRGDPDVTVLHAGYWIEKTGRLEQLPGWRPFDVLHFPCRSLEQWARKTARRGHADSDAPLGQYVKGLQAQERGRIEDLYETLVVDDEALREGIDTGYLVIDARLRDALRRLGFGRAQVETVTRPESAAALPIDAAALTEATLVRLQRRMDEALLRVDRVERRLGRFVRPRRTAQGGVR